MFQSLVGEKEERNASPAFERRVRSDVWDVPLLRREVDAYCQAQGISDEACSSFDLAVGEALANAIRHGMRGNPHDPILSIWRYGDFLIANVRDFGPGFEPPVPPYAMPAPEAGGVTGRGLPIMALLTDAILISRGDVEEGGGVSVFLVKRIPERP